MKEKPIFRFTLGNTHQNGLDILVLSIKNLKKIYPEAKIVVCYNNIVENNVLKNLNVELFHVQDKGEMEYEPKREMWKLYPPRYNINAHEIVMDNDVFLFTRCQQIDDFFQGNHCLLLRGKARSYGKYDHLVQQPFALNSGFYGMPPLFDFLSHIKDTCKNDEKREWTQWCDDQGVISHCLMKEKYKIVENDTILNYFAEDSFDISLEIKGIHLIGVNRGLRENWRSILYNHLIKH